MQRGPSTAVELVHIGVSLDQGAYKPEFLLENCQVHGTSLNSATDIDVDGLAANELESDVKVILEDSQTKGCLLVVIEHVGVCLALQEC